jgi:hypothetical protein
MAVPLYSDSEPGTSSTADGGLDVAAANGRTDEDESFGGEGGTTAAPS